MSDPTFSVRPVKVLWWTMHQVVNDDTGRVFWTYFRQWYAEGVAERAQYQHSEEGIRHKQRREDFSDGYV